MKNFVRLLPILILVLVVALPASAQNVPKTGELGVDVLYTGYSSLPVDDAVGGRFRVGFSLSRLIGLEFRYAYSSTEETGTGEDVDSQQWGAHVLFNFHPSEKNRPYVLLGFTRDDFTGTRVAPPDVETLEVGGGWRHWFTKRWGIRGEAALGLRGEDNNWGDALMVEDVDFRLAAGASVSLGQKERMTWAPKEKKEKPEPAEGEAGARKAGKKEKAKKEQPAEEKKAAPEAKPEPEKKPEAAPPPPPSEGDSDEEFDPREGIERKPPRK